MWTERGGDRTGVVYMTTPTPCYANCDGSTATPLLTAHDFLCFVNTHALGCL